MTDDNLPVRAVVLRQPWAWAVIHAGKDIENRDWRPSDRRPCNLLIQAGVIYDIEGEKALTDHYGIEVPLIAQKRAVYVGVVTVDTWHLENGSSRWSLWNYWHWHFTGPVAAHRDVWALGRRRVFEPAADWPSAFHEAVVERVQLGHPAARWRE